jgi:hypothetical protein
MFSESYTASREHFSSWAAGRTRKHDSRSRCVWCLPFEEAEAVSRDTYRGSSLHRSHQRAGGKPSRKCDARFSLHGPTLNVHCQARPGHPRTAAIMQTAVPIITCHGTASKIIEMAVPIITCNGTASKIMQTAARSSHATVLAKKSYGMIIS